MALCEGIAEMKEECVNNLISSIKAIKNTEEGNLLVSCTEQDLENY